MSQVKVKDQVTGYCCSARATSSSIVNAKVQISILHADRGLIKVMKVILYMRHFWELTKTRMRGRACPLHSIPILVSLKMIKEETKIPSFCSYVRKLIEKKWGAREGAPPSHPIFVLLNRDIHIFWPFPSPWGGEFFVQIENPGRI